MSQDHLDRLSAIDASFLHQEGPNSHMHIGAMMIFEGPPPPFEQFLDHIRGRLHYVPRFRQKLAVPPLQAGRPLWVDDPNFHLTYHVRHTALPDPGSEDQLRRLAARLFSQSLDRSKPLWELWLVQGVEKDRFALITKTHHAVVDGISGVDLATVLLDTTQSGKVQRGDTVSSWQAVNNSWQPRPELSQSKLIVAGAKDATKAALKLAGKFALLATHPGRSVRKASEALEGLGELVWAGLNPAPSTPFNVEIGPHRRLAFTREQLDSFKQIKDTFGGTVNDVVLAVISGALADFIRARGMRTEGLELRALVPVSIRSGDEQDRLGNRIVAMRGPLPVYIEDPVARLKAVSKSMEGLKESKQAVGAKVLTSVENLAPPTVLAQASRVHVSSRLFNLIVTNIPGPQVPLYLMGRELIDLFPIAFLPKNQALSTAIMSYNGKVNFGLLGDYDALPDLDMFAEAIDRSLQQLLTLARRKPTRKTRSS